MAVLEILDKFVHHVDCINAGHVLLFARFVRFQHEENSLGQRGRQVEVTRDWSEVATQPLKSHETRLTEKILDAANLHIDDMQQKYQRWGGPRVSFYVTDCGWAFGFACGREGGGAARGGLCHELGVAGGVVYICNAVRSADAWRVQAIQN